MNTRLIAGLFVAGMAAGWIGGAAHARVGGQTPSAQVSEEERARLVAKGREIFVDKCAKCHNERGDKALSSGQPLNERGLTTETIGKAVSGRLKDRTEEEKRAVTLYIASLMKKDAEKAEPKP